MQGYPETSCCSRTSLVPGRSLGSLHEQHKRFKRLSPPEEIPRFISGGFPGEKWPGTEGTGIFKAQRGAEGTGPQPTRSGQRGKGKERGHSTGQATGL